MEELKSTGEDPVMLALLLDLAEQLPDCANWEYFQAKKEALIDPESDMDAMEAADAIFDE